MFNAIMISKAIPRHVLRNSLARQTTSVMCYSDSKPEIPKNTLSDVYSATAQKENGVPYDKKPFKMALEEGKKYHWCLCGRSKNQPMCDGTHKDVFLKITQRPIRFTVDKTKDYWLCNCKHTKNRPFCDGTHKQKHIQESSYIKI